MKRNKLVGLEQDALGQLFIVEKHMVGVLRIDIHVQRAVRLSIHRATVERQDVKVL
jgi:hypothetical protein